MDAKTAKAQVLIGPRQLELQEFPLPEIGPDDGLLMMERCGLCGSDIEEYEGSLVKLGYDKPMIPGHELVGKVVKVGERAARRWNVRPGDRVAVEVHIPCMECRNCQSGRTNNCNGSPLVPHTGFGAYGVIATDVAPSLFGGYAEYLYLHPNARMHKLPDSLPVELATLFNPLGSGINWGYEVPDLRMGDSILVMGAGQRGLSLIIAARAAGAGQVIVTGTSRSRFKLDLARQFGADEVIVADEEDVVDRVRHLTGGEGVDVVVDTTPNDSRPFLDALAAIRPGGKIILAGVKKPELAIERFDANRIFQKAAKVTGVMAASSYAYREAIRLLARDPERYRCMLSATYPLRDAAMAVDHLAGRGPGEPGLHIAIAPHME